MKVIRTANAPPTAVILRLCGIVRQVGDLSEEGSIGSCSTQSPSRFLRRRCGRSFGISRWHRELSVIDATPPRHRLGLARNEHR